MAKLSQNIVDSLGNAKIRARGCAPARARVHWGHLVVFGQITKESAGRGRNMKKVIKRKMCRISILHNEKKISGQISNISTPKIWKIRFEVK